MASRKNKMRRTVFTIYLGRKVMVSALKGKNPSSEDGFKFSSERELRRLTAEWPGARLVEIWNQLPGVRPVTRFTNRDIAMRRIWTALQTLVPHRNLADGPDGATKAESIVALLKGPSGASLGSIMDLTGWQAHSIRGFISAQVCKRMGFKVESFKSDGERIYRIRP